MAGNTEQNLALEAMQSYGKDGVSFLDAVQKMKASGWSLPDNLMGDFQKAFTAGGGNVVATGSKYGIPSAESVGQKAISESTTNPYGKFVLPEGADAMTGGNPIMSMPGAFGGNGYTGWVTPALGAASAIGKTVLGYQQLEAEKENNAKKLALMEEANFMKKLKMKNQVNQANRYQMLGTGNSNSQTATMRSINKTPYTSMGLV